jgi:glycerol-3-phosphate acyltransferase PlsY
MPPDLITTTGLLLLAGGYLLGSIASAIIVCKLMGLPDPRTVGSNNPGATNVLRHGGKKAAAITLLGDMLKGLLAVLLARVVADAEINLALAGLGAFLGHLYPLYFRFQGGKGVATFFGVLLGINWLAGVSTLLCWLLFAKVFKISSLAALITAVIAPVLLFYFGSAVEVIVISSAMSVLLIWRHRSNIRNLIAGTEDAIASKESVEDGEKQTLAANNAKDAKGKTS